jgi:GDP-4-dehydro-6-deoxy-D-mannose reductase
MKVLVTGADGFVGKWTCLQLVEAGHEVVGGVRRLSDLDSLPAHWREKLRAMRWVECELRAPASVRAALEGGPAAIIHLAAMASGAEARANPVAAWDINCLGTCELLYAIERMGLAARFILASTGEVYGRALHRPAAESDPVAPCSPYAASKAGAEIAALEFHRRTSGDAVVVRPFAQTGPGQRVDFVAPAFARRILAAREAGTGQIAVGNLEPVREFLDVRDVASALTLLLTAGRSGEVYNIAQGAGVALVDLFKQLADLLGWHGTPVPDPTLFRAGDIPMLVGDGTRLASLGWRARYDLRTTLSDLIATL